ncbi:MAG: GNAT family N-acetyltransferase [Paracoccus sp. (in: a-proteobacteria)]|uniref:GNAT family N-acetyltransferase n=1 Tax=Paracoccus sp. TaxID=267 RepID=UPI0025D6E27C|nr:MULTISPECIES: GNAT family N-acetyltransferase [unclassified Paracoccus (in: a-proteobacteria)]
MNRRAQIEGVCVAPDLRSRGLGEALMRDAEYRARTEGCALIRFTSNPTRTGARRFCDRPGFTPGHIGYKKPSGLLRCPNTRIQP